MRVLSVGNMYPPHHLGGYELIWRSAERHLREQGHQTRVLASDHREAAPVGAEDPDVHRDLRWWWHDHGFPRMSVRERVAVERHNARAFDRHVAEFEPDVVAWWAMGGMSVSLIERARRAGLPAVGFVIDDWLIYAPMVDGWMRLFDRVPWLRRPVDFLTGLPTEVDAGASARWLFVSDAVRQSTFRRSRWRLPETDIAHVGVDPAFYRGEAADEWGWRVLYAGRLDERKGIDTAVAALAQLPAGASLRVVGDGDADYGRGLREQAQRLGIADRVRLEAGQARERLARTYAESDVVVFPVRWDEPWGLVPLEAMAVGRPVVATGTGGSGEYLRDGENCLLFAAGDAEALARAVERIAADDSLRERLRAGGLATAARFTERAYNERVEAELERAARARQTRT